jgi:hypothetical protein
LTPYIRSVYLVCYEGTSSTALPVMIRQYILFEAKAAAVSPKVSKSRTREGLFTSRDDVSDLSTHVYLFSRDVVLTCSQPPPLSLMPQRSSTCRLCLGHCSIVNSHWGLLGIGDIHNLFLCCRHHQNPPNFPIITPFFPSQTDDFSYHVTSALIT